MERERFTLALLLCLFVTIFYINLVTPTTKQNNQNKNTNTDQSNEKNNPDPKNKEQENTNNPPQNDSGWKPDSDIKLAILENEALKIEFTSQGASIQNLWLKKYFYASTDKSQTDWQLQPKNWLQLLTLSEKEKSGSFALQLEGLPYDSSKENWKIQETTPDSVTFTFEPPTGPILTKKYRLVPVKPDPQRSPQQNEALQYQIQFEIQLQNRSAQEERFRFSLHTGRKMLQEPETNSYGAYPTFHASYGTTDSAGGTKGHYVSVPDISKLGFEGKTIERATLENEYQQISWAGLMNKYFACLVEIPEMDRKLIGQTEIRPLESYSILQSLIQDTTDPKKKAELTVRQAENISLTMETVEFKVPANETRTLSWKIHCGPKDTLEASGLAHIIDLGFFETFARLMIWILDRFYLIIGNYGFAIVLLTLIVKMAMFPLTRKQQVSMQDYTEKMNKIRPKMEQIRQKHGTDRVKMNEETMKLFRENNVQIFPFMGCLPLFVQLPIFFGIFSALQVYPPLRQAGWLWIQDLTAPDRLFTFGTHFWLIGDAFNLMPILMTITWFVQTKMMPKSDDPQMQLNQKMMQFMPILIGFIMYSAPSGLALYWFFSTFLGVLEQMYIKKYVKKEVIFGGTVTQKNTAKESSTNKGAGFVESIFGDQDGSFKDKKKNNAPKNEKNNKNEFEKKKNKSKKNKK